MHFIPSALPRILCVILSGAGGSGCLTSAAIRDLRGPNDLMDVAVRQEAADAKPSGLAWKATFGDKPDLPDNIVTPYLHRSVSSIGVAAWPEVDGLKCVELFVGPNSVRSDEFVSVQEDFTSILGQRAHGACTLSLSRFVEGAGIAALTVSSPRRSDGTSTVVAVIPNEQPLSTPERWVWLLVSPILDLASLAVIPPFLLGLELSD